MVLKKLRISPQAPPVFTGTPTSIISDTKRLIEHARSVQVQIAENVKPEAAIFANVLLPLAHAQNAVTLEAHILGFYRDVSTSSELRDASNQAKKLLDDFSIDTSMNEGLYKLVDAVLKKNEDLDPESCLLLQKQHKNYIQNGLGLPLGPERDRFKEIKKQVNELSITFRKNLTDEEVGVWFEPQELEGIPTDVLSALDKGEGEHEGKLRLTFKDPDLYPTLRFAKNSETRKRYYIANANQCNQNVPVFKKIMVLRDEAARMLGYPNHAAFRLEDKMAKTPETVDSFLADLRSRLFARGQREVEQLKRLKGTDLISRGQSFNGRDYFLWDHSFYNRMMLEKDYLVDQQKVAEYFPLQTTIEGMLDIFARFFGLAFVEITAEERSQLVNSGNGSDTVWHEDVQMFSVWDDEQEGNGFVGYLYLDCFPREGKYGHAGNFNLQPGFIQEDGTRRYPATALVCNFPKPLPDKPSLMKHDAVVLLFHELGHGIHDLVSKTIYSCFHGTNTVDDFCEAPSQMLENWCWTPSILTSLSRHYSSLSPEYFKVWQAEGKNTPPDQIPDEMIKSLIKAKDVNSALFNLRQLQLGIFDMTVHEPESHEAIKKMNISATYNRLLREIFPLDGPEALDQGDEWGHSQAYFNSLMHAYDAGYYGYLFSKVYSTDMFYTIFKSDLMDPKEGRRYRHAVLEKGGSQDEMKTLTDFLGREPRIEAFYKELGLS